MQMLEQMPRDETRLLRAYDVMEITGLSYADALALVKSKGIKIGRRYFITPDELMRALKKK